MVFVDCGRGTFVGGEVSESVGEVGVARCYLVVVLEENFVLIKKFGGIIKGIFEDKNKILVLFYFIYR